MELWTSTDGVEPSLTLTQTQTLRLFSLRFVQRSTEKEGKTPIKLERNPLFPFHPFFLFGSLTSAKLNRGVDQLGRNYSKRGEGGVVDAPARSRRCRRPSSKRSRDLRHCSRWTPTQGRCRWWCGWPVRRLGLRRGLATIFLLCIGEKPLSLWCYCSQF